LLSLCFANHQTTNNNQIINSIHQFKSNAMPSTPESLAEAGIHLLPESPKDGITSLCYVKSEEISSSLLASTSWDGCLRIHDTSHMNTADGDSNANGEGPKLVTLQNMDSGPLLSLCTIGNTVYTGGLDGSIKKFDIETSTVTTIGYHPSNMDNDNDSGNGNGASTDMACSCLNVIPFVKDGKDDGHILASAGWNSQFYLWDVSSSTSEPIYTTSLPDKALSMDVDPSNPHRIAISAAGRRLIVIAVQMPDNFDTSKISADIVLDRESSLKFQSRVCRFFPDGIGLAIGSVEGRVAIEFLNELDVSSNGMKKYAFKCHRVDSIVYPVNAIAFHPIHGTFATGGCDGSVVTWDGLHKKKLVVLPKFPSSIAAMAFNRDGSELAIASSYTFEDGDRGDDAAGKDEIYVKQMLDSEVRPKTGK